MKDLCAFSLDFKGDCAPITTLPISRDWSENEAKPSEVPRYVSNEFFDFITNLKSKLIGRIIYYIRSYNIQYINCPIIYTVGLSLDKSTHLQRRAEGNLAPCRFLTHEARPGRRNSVGTLMTRLGCTHTLIVSQSEGGFVLGFII